MNDLNENIFREYDIRGIVGEDLTGATVTTISRAIASYFIQNGAQEIVVGYDARESSPSFQEILISELLNAGCDVIDIGRVPTPVTYFALYTRKADGAVMITGSHNPSNHNGFKISLGKNSLYGKEIQKIKKIALSGKFRGRHNLVGEKQDAFTTIIKPHKPKVTPLNILNEYLNELWRRIEMGERKLKAVVDAGNGMGGVTAIPLYQRLGVETIELFCEPDSSFPAHEPDPSQEENLQDLIEKVLETKADLGIAFDGDADRITIIDDTGKIIWGDELMILLARETLSENPNATIIAEVKCTQRLFDEIENSGGRGVMSKAGHSIIKAKMRETGAILGGEMSGHIFFADIFYGFDDGAYAGARVLEILSKTDEKLSEIFARFPQTVSTPEIRIKCAEEKKAFVLEKIIEEFSETYEVITIDGARIKFENGWGLVRPSNTQALLILRFEADTAENLKAIQKIVENRVNHFNNQEIT